MWSMSFSIPGDMVPYDMGILLNAPRPPKASGISSLENLTVGGLRLLLRTWGPTEPRRLMREKVAEPQPTSA